MKIKDFLQQIARQETETRIGKVDQSLAQAIKENRKAHDAAHERIEKEIHDFVAKLRAEHDPECERFEREKADIWERIFDELGLDEAERGEEYSIDHTTGVVSRVNVVNPFEDKIKPVGPLQ